MDGFSLILPLLWSTFYPPYFCWKSFKCVSQHLASNFEKSWGSQDELKSDACDRSPVSFPQWDKFLNHKGHHPGRRLFESSKRITQEVGYLVSYSTRWQKCGLLLAVSQVGWHFTQTPRWHWRVCVLLSILWIRVYKSPVRWFFNGSNAPSICS